MVVAKSAWQEAVKSVKAHSFEMIETRTRQNSTTLRRRRPVKPALHHMRITGVAIASRYRLCACVRVHNSKRNHRQMASLEISPPSTLVNQRIRSPG